MDFLNKKFIAALNCLREEVSALQKNIDSLRDEYKTQHEYDRNQSPPPVIIQSELQVPEATNEITDAAMIVTTDSKYGLRGELGWLSEPLPFMPELPLGKPPKYVATPEWNRGRL
jgi:hypothetical protein